MTEKSNRLPDRLYLLRTSKRIHQKTLANAIGVEPPMYSRIEKGERNIRLDQLDILAEYLGVDAEELHSIWLADKMSDVSGQLPKEIVEKAILIIKENL